MKTNGIGLKMRSKIYFSWSKKLNSHLLKSFLFLLILNASFSSAQNFTEVNGAIHFNKDSLMKLVSKFNFERYSVSPNLPSELMDKKADIFHVPKDETICAFVDASVNANSRFGIIIGLKALYINNFGSATVTGLEIMPYYALQTSDIIKMEKKKEYRVRQTYLNLVGLKKPDVLMFGTLLTELKSKLSTN